MPHGAGASRRPYVELSSRRVHLAGVTANPDFAWMSQQARNLAIEERLENVRFLLHDRDAKFSGPFDEIIASEGVRVIKTPIRSPRANAVAERWVRTVLNECLDHLLVFGRRHLEQILGGYVAHFNAERPHRSLELVPPAGSPRSRGSPPSPRRAGRADPRVLRCRRMSDSNRAFLVARNPDADSKLPYLLRLPPEDGIVLKARESWPVTARVYCHRFAEAWPAEAEIIDQAPVLLCRRRGAAIDLVLDRPRLARSQFVFTQVKGREAIFWQTQKTARAANPGGRIPRRRTLTDAVTIAVDTRERYPYRFTQQRAETVRATVPAGDYAVQTTDGTVLAGVERKSLERTSPPRSPTERSPSRCNASPSSRSQLSSSKPGTRRSTSWRT